jgi:signal peptidase II
LIKNILFTAVLIFADRLSKVMAAKYLADGTVMTVIPYFLGLRYLENTGMAFSMLSGKTVFLAVITAAALIIMAYFLFVKNYGERFERFCFILIFAGGVGNLIDRVFQGYVIDYFEFLFMDFAIFNVADVYVCVGVGLYAIYTFYTEFYKKENK